MNDLIIEILEHIKVIKELSGIQYVLKRDSRYGWKICIRLKTDVMMFRGSLEKLNEHMVNLEESARFWAS